MPPRSASSPRAEATQWRSRASGTEVTWTNGDPEEHTVTADDGTFDSGPIASGKSYSVTVDQSGAVTYFCGIHPTMKGTVRVS